MAVARYQLPDGRIARYEVPDAPVAPAPPDPASPQAQASDIASGVRQDLADVYHGGRATAGHVLSALLPDYSPHKKDAAEMIADENKVQNKLLGAIPTMIATAPLVPLVGGAGALAKGAYTGGSELARLAAASGGRIAGGAALGGALGGLETAGTDKPTLPAIGTGALVGGLVQGAGEALPGVATAVAAGKNALVRAANNTPEATLTRNVTGLVDELGGYISPQDAGNQIGDLFRPALERYGKGLGKQFDKFYEGRSATLDPQFTQDVQRAIENEQRLAAPDQSFIRTASQLIDPEGLVFQGGKTTAETLQRNLTDFGRLSKTRGEASDKQAYGSLSQAIRDLQARNLSPQDALKLEELRKSYKYFKDVGRGTPDDNSALFSRIKSGERDTLTHLRNVLDNEDFQKVSGLAGQSLLSDLEAASRGYRPSQPVDPAAFESGLNRLAPEARQAFLPERSLAEMSLPSPQSFAQTMGNKLAKIGGGLVGAKLGSLAGGHTLSGYAAGRELTKQQLARALGQAEAPLAETLPGLTSRVTPRLIQLLMGAP